MQDFYLKGDNQMYRENENVRRAARAAGVPFWAVAAKLQVSEATLTRWMRFPLPADREQSIMEAIDQLAKEAG